MHALMMLSVVCSVLTSANHHACTDDPVMCSNFYKSYLLLKSFLNQCTSILPEILLKSVGKGGKLPFYFLDLMVRWVMIQLLILHLNPFCSS